MVPYKRSGWCNRRIKSIAFTRVNNILNVLERVETFSRPTIDRHFRLTIAFTRRAFPGCLIVVTVVPIVVGPSIVLPLFLNATGFTARRHEEQLRQLPVHAFRSLTGARRHMRPPCSDKVAPKWFSVLDEVTSYLPNRVKWSATAFAHRCFAQRCFEWRSPSCSHLLPQTFLRPLRCQKRFFDIKPRVFSDVESRPLANSCHTFTNVVFLYR